MKFIIEINCDNAAFDDYGMTEIKRILSVIDDRLPFGASVAAPIPRQPVKDANGNTCGFWELQSAMDYRMQTNPSEFPNNSD